MCSIVVARRLLMFALDNDNFIAVARSLFMLA